MQIYTHTCPQRAKRARQAQLQIELRQLREDLGQLGDTTNLGNAPPEDAGGGDEEPPTSNARRKKVKKPTPYDRPPRRRSRAVREEDRQPDDIMQLLMSRGTRLVVTEFIWEYSGTFNPEVADIVGYDPKKRFDSTGNMIQGEREAVKSLLPVELRTKITNAGVYEPVSSISVPLEH